MIDELVDAGRTRAAPSEVVIGMAHRGRLSVLAHNLGRSAESIFAEFEGAKAIEEVKAVAAIPTAAPATSSTTTAHEGMFTTRDGEEIKVRLYPNPSHLEFVDPVVTGARARRRRPSARDPSSSTTRAVAVPVLLHGDAAFPGQGVVAETLNLQSLAGYSTGGTIHIIQNNQVGFTTDPEEGRSTPYAADMAKGFNVPDHPRQRRRRRGLRRGDPPGDGLPRALGPRRGHRPDRLPPLRPQRDRRARLHAAADGGADQGAPAGLRDLRRAAGRRRASSAPRRSRPRRSERRDELQADHKELREKMEAGEYEDPTSTAIGTGELDRTTQPRGRDRGRREAAAHAQRGAAAGPRQLHDPPQAAQAARRSGSTRSTRAAIEFGHAEALAFASLLTEGIHIRLTGQDTERGTFSHRHLVLHDEKTGLEYAPIQNLPDAQGAVRAPQQPALGGRLPRLRVRLLGGLARQPGPLGGAVRRLRQLGPGDHRQLHRLRPRRSGARRRG